MTKIEITNQLENIKGRLDGILDELTEVSLEVAYFFEPENCSDEMFAEIRDNLPSDAARVSIEDAIDFIKTELQWFKHNHSRGWREGNHPMLHSAVRHKPQTR